MMLIFWLLVIPFGMSSATETMKEFDINNGKWSSYSKKLEMYFKVHSTKDDLKLATMILMMGDNAYELLLNLATPKEPTELTYMEANELLKELDSNLPVLKARYFFRHRKQRIDENNSFYVTELKKLARACNFGAALGVNLRDQFIFGMKNDAIRERLLAETDRLTFPEAVKIALGKMESDKADVEAIAVSQTLESSKLPQEDNEKYKNYTQLCPGSNPRTPFTCPIPNGVHPGRIIRVRAYTSTNVQRFSMNLVCGSGETLQYDDVAFHIDFRFFLNEVVRNSMNANLPTHTERWSYWTEEKDQGMPIARGESFEAVILCLEKYFTITINDKHFTDFYHHIPIYRITNFLMDGDVSVQSVSFEDICNDKQRIDMVRLATTERPLKRR